MRHVGLFLGIGTIAASCLASWAVFPASARADFFIHHWEDHYEPPHGASLEADLLYYSSTQNYDSGGDTVTPAGTSSGSTAATLDDYHRLGVDVLGQFGLFDRFSLFGRVSWARFQVDDSAASSTTYGLADQSVGGDYRVLGNSGNSGDPSGSISSLALDLQAQVDVPAYSNSSDQASKSPYQGDGSVDVSVGGFLTVPISQVSTGSFSLLGGVGFTHRSDGYSSAVPWNISGEYAPKSATSGFLASLSALGLTSLKTDASAPVSQVNGFVTGSGGSFITNAINPSLVVLRGQAGYQFQSGNQVLAAVEQSVWGQDAPAGTGVIFGFRMNFGNAAGAAPPSSSDQGLAQYTLNAKVTKTNDRLNLLKIDKGYDDGIAKGQIFDVFSVNDDGTVRDQVARCQVTSVKSDEAALTVIEYFKEVWINEGFIAKRLAQ